MAKKNTAQQKSAEEILKLRDDEKVLRPKAVSRNVAVALGGSVPNPILTTNEKLNSVASWEKVYELHNSIAQSIAEVAASIAQTVDQVSLFGCSNMVAFNKAVEAVNSDLLCFATDLKKLREGCGNNSGPATNPNEMAAILAVGEQYEQLSVNFMNCANNSMIAFTSFALEAKDRLMAMTAEERKTLNDRVNKAIAGAAENNPTKTTAE